MSQASLSKRKIEEILRLKFEVGLPHRAIAKSCGVSTSTVSEYATHAKAAGLSWPLLIYQLCFPLFDLYRWMVADWESVQVVAVADQFGQTRWNLNECVNTQFKLILNEFKVALAKSV